MKSKSMLPVLLAAGLLASLSAEAGDLAEIKLRRDGVEHALSVDLAQLGEGQTRQLSTAAGLPAIVSRDQGRLAIEVAGQSFEVKLGPVVDLQMPDAAAGEHRIELLHADGDPAADLAKGAAVKVIRVARGDAHRLTGHADKVVVVRAAGEAALDEQALTELIEQARSAAGSGSGDSEIEVRRTITRESNER